jgi:hypothetical protein
MVIRQPSLTQCAAMNCGSLSYTFTLSLPLAAMERYCAKSGRGFWPSTRMYRSASPLIGMSVTSTPPLPAGTSNWYWSETDAFTLPD